MIYRRLMAILIATTLSLGTAVVPCLASLALVSDQAAETFSRAADSAPVPHETPQRPLVLENQSAIGNTVSGSSMPPGSSSCFGVGYFARLSHPIGKRSAFVSS